MVLLCNNACKGPQGDVGPAGVTGVAGPTGSANVTQYKFVAAKTFPADYTIPVGSADLDNRFANTTVYNAQDVRIVIVPASNLISGRKAAVDYDNYEEVKTFYNLPD